MSDIDTLDIPNDSVARKVELARHLVETSDNRMSQLHRAELLLREALAELPDHARINHALALALVYQGRSLESIPFHRAAYSRTHEHLGVLYSYLDALIFNNHHAEAKQAIGEWERHHPKDSTILGFEETIDFVLQSHKPKAMIHWPQRVEDLRDPRQAFRKYLFTSATPQGYQFTAASKVLTLGSCFAQNIARVLNRRGASAVNITLGEVINSTYANLHYLRRVIGEDTGEVGAVIAERLGRDPLDDQPLFRDADLVVMTLGVAPCFFDCATNEFVMFREREFAFRQLGDRYQWRNTTVAENKDNIRRIFSILHALNPKLRIIVSVSPVPLVCTFDYESAVIADCVSKSTLRAAVDEALRESGQAALYWPSFEAFRWIGGYTGEAFGADDGCSCHASEQMLEHVFEIFMEKFFTLAEPAQV